MSGLTTTTCLLIFLGTMVIFQGALGAPLQFADMVTRITKFRPSDLLGYANYCGVGGGGPPLDNLDRCCQVHDRCLSRTNRSSCSRLGYISFFVVHYRYMFTKNGIVCNGNYYKCQNDLCECDRVAAECFRIYQHEYNPSLKMRPV